MNHSEQRPDWRRLALEAFIVLVLVAVASALVYQVDGRQINGLLAETLEQRDQVRDLGITLGTQVIQLEAMSLVVEQRGARIDLLNGQVSYLAASADRVCLDLAGVKHE